MNDFGLGAGLAALGFWVFLAGVSIAGIWDAARKRDAQHETLRQVLGGDKDLDPDLEKKLVDMISGSGRPDRDFKVAALWVLPIAPGVALLAYFIGRISTEAFAPLIGVACLLAVMGIGFWIAGVITARWFSR